MNRLRFALAIAVLLALGIPFAYGQKQTSTKPKTSATKATHDPWKKSKNDKLVATITHDQLLKKDIILGVTVNIGTKDIFMWEDMDTFLSQKGSTVQVWATPGTYYRIERRDYNPSRPKDVPMDMFVWPKTQLAVKKRVSKTTYTMMSDPLKYTASDYATYTDGAWLQPKKPAKPAMRT